MKRIKIKPRKPNPLFEIWLEEWRKEAVSRNSDLQYQFTKALASLKKYPLPLKSGKDCIILQHFGTKLCSMLDRKLEDYKAQNDGSTENDVCLLCNHDERHVLKRKFKSQQIISNANFEHDWTEMAVFDNLNLPLWAVENYAALLLLYKKIEDPYFSGHVTETDLLYELQKLCGHISKTAVSNVIDHGLISMAGSPIRYSLTVRGINVSRHICEITATDVKTINSMDVLRKIRVSIEKLFTCNSEKTKSIKNINKGNASTQTTNKYSKDAQSNDSGKSLRFYKSKSAGFISTAKPVQYHKSPAKQKCRENDTLVRETYEKLKRPKTTSNCSPKKLDNETNFIHTPQKNIYLESSKFDVILLVDSQEISGGKTKPQHDATIVELTELGVLFEIRHLKVGDFAWIARCKRTNNELILPYIVERKRIDDLSASITDGRFYEQKFRLKQSGIPNLMYIIEEYERSQRLTIPHLSLMQASINTLMQDGFSVKYTKNHKNSMFYLSSLTRVLIKVFKHKNLLSCEKEAIAQTDISSNTCNLMVFEKFNKAASKQKVFQVSQMFVRQLLQLKGLSVEKALAIVECYPTPRLLIEAFQNCESDRELLLANIQYGDKKRSIGKTISKTIYQLYTKNNFN